MWTCDFSRKRSIELTMTLQPTTDHAVISQVKIWNYNKSLTVSNTWWDYGNDIKSDNRINTWWDYGNDIKSDNRINVVITHFII